MPAPFRKGAPPSARQLNAVAEQARRAQNARGGGLYGGFRNTPAGASFYPLDPKSFWARLDDYDPDSGAYAFTEQQDSADTPGTMIDATDGRVGTLDPLSQPVYAIGGLVLATEADGAGSGAIVRAWPALGGDWFLCGDAGAGTSVAMARITGKPKLVGAGSVRHYPGVLRTLDDTPAFADADTTVWVVSERNGYLGTTGEFVVLALRDGSATVAGDTRPRYRTSDMIVMIDFDCDTGQGCYTGTFEGDDV